MTVFPRLLCLLALSSAAACRPPEPLAVAASRSVDADTAAYLGALAGLVEAHAWGEVFARCDPAHVDTQVGSFGMSRPQYLAEALGLHDVDNDIGGDTTITEAHLDRIRRVWFDAAEGHGAELRVSGHSLVGGRGWMRIVVQLVRGDDGRWWITGAVG